MFYIIKQNQACESFFNCIYNCIFKLIDPKKKLFTFIEKNTQELKMSQAIMKSVQLIIFELEQDTKINNK